jgi:probable HAF family extracellular repeat protein
MAHTAWSSPFSRKIAVTLLSVFIAACGGSGSNGASLDTTSSPAAQSQNTGTTQTPSSAVDPTTLPDRVTGEALPTASSSSANPAPQPAQNTEPAWSVADLTAVIGPDSRPVAMNDAGVIVGVTIDPNGTRSLPPVENPFLLKNGQMTNLGNLGGSYGGAKDINNAGQIAGYSYVRSVGQTHAFIHENGTMKDIGALIGSGGSWSTNINASGQVAIYSNDKTYIYSNGVVKPISDVRVLPAGINDSGQIAGTQLSGPLGQAVFYNGTTLINLGTLNGTDSGIAIALNNAGQVVGVSYTLGGSEYRGFVYSEGVMREFGPVNTRSSASSINNAGDIVGWIEIASNQPHAFMYKNGTMIDLNTLPGIAGSGWVLTGAIKINNAGQILAGGSFNGQRRYCLLTPPA